MFSRLSLVIPFSCLFVSQTAPPSRRTTSALDAELTRLHAAREVLLSKRHQTTVSHSEATELAIVNAEESLVQQQLEWDEDMVQAQIAQARAAATDTFMQVVQ